MGLDFDHIHDGSIRGCIRMSGVAGGKRAPYLKSVAQSYHDEIWHSYTFHKEDPNNIVSADISIFPSDISYVFCIKKYRYRLHFKNTHKEKAPSNKTALLIWTFGSLVHRINSLYEVLNLKQNFKRKKSSYWQNSVLWSISVDFV